MKASLRELYFFLEKHLTGPISNRIVDSLTMCTKTEECNIIKIKLFKDLTTCIVKMLHFWNFSCGTCS